MSFSLKNRFENMLIYLVLLGIVQALNGGELQTGETALDCFLQIRVILFI